MMNAGALVYCILDADGAYTPDGYELIDTAIAGDYELRLWKGNQHVSETPVKFYEVSLNAAGRSFDPASQATKFPGSVHALGHRSELVKVIAGWLKRYKELYIGSYELPKVNLYHRLFKRYLHQFNITEPFPAFDECEDKPEYFKVTAPDGLIESILESDDDVDVQRYVAELPSAMDRAFDYAKAEITRKIENGIQAGMDVTEIDPDNLHDELEATVIDALAACGLTEENDEKDDQMFQTIFQRTMEYVDQKWPDDLP